MGAKFLGQDLNDKEKLELAMEHVHDRTMATMAKGGGVEVVDEDEDRGDLDDADDEELEDRLVEAYRENQRPLRMEDVARLSRRNNVDGQNMSMSILSGVMNPHDYNNLSQSIMHRSMRSSSRDNNFRGQSGQ